MFIPDTNVYRLTNHCRSIRACVTISSPTAIAITTIA